MKVSEQIVAARKLIAKEANWCKKADCIDKKGKPHLVDDGDLDKHLATAKAVCTQTAVYKITKEWGSNAQRILESVCKTKVLGDWNDHAKRTHEQVLEAFDKAIAKAKELEAAKNEKTT